jgi:hypothetical protein
MAALVLTSAKIQVAAAWTGTAPGLPGTQTISGTLTTPSDISGYVTKVTLPEQVAMQPATNFASGGYEVNLSGLKSAQVQLELNQDYAAAALDTIIRTTLGGLGATVYIDVMPTSSARSATNPSYVFACIINSYAPVSGSVGNLATLSVSWPTTGAFGTLTA